MSPVLSTCYVRSKLEGLTKHDSLPRSVEVLHRLLFRLDIRATRSNLKGIMIGPDGVMFIVKVEYGPE